MGEMFVVRDIETGEYLAKKLMRGYFFTSDISHAIRRKTYEEAEEEIDKQMLKISTTLTIDTVNFS